MLNLPVFLLITSSIFPCIQMESLCLLTDFGSVDISGAYILTYVGQDTLIPPGSTCIVSTCFAPNSYNSLYLSPSKSCLTG